MHWHSLADGILRAVPAGKDYGYRLIEIAKDPRDYRWLLFREDLREDEKGKPGSLKSLGSGPLSDMLWHCHDRENS